jgi:hypothetical protein
MQATSGNWMVDLQHRQIHTSLFVAALVVAFGIGLLTGLVALRTAGQGAPTVAHVSTVAAPVAVAPAAAWPGLTANGQDLKLAALVGLISTHPTAHVNAVAAPAVAPAAARSALTANGQDLKLAALVGSIAPAAPAVARSAITANGQDIKPANLLGWR